MAADIDGNFTIDVPEKGKFLVISYVGMKPQELPIRSIDPSGTTIRLEEEDNALNEVVVTGMGARKKITVTGAVTKCRHERHEALQHIEPFKCIGR